MQGAIPFNGLNFLHSAYKDISSGAFGEADRPSRLANITLPGAAGTILGGLVGVAANHLTAEPQTPYSESTPERIAKMLLVPTAGALLGGGIGRYLGAKHYNERLDDLVDKTKKNLR
jgi:hypothetical protein